MTTWQYAIAHATKVLVIATLLGSLARGRCRLCWSFAAYLLVILTCNSLVSFWPERFFVEWFWMLQQTAYDLAKLAVAIELAHRSFRAFPGARATARLVLLSVLALTTVAVVTVPASSSSTFLSFTLTEWHPRIASGTIWLMTSTALLAVWYQLPVHAFQRAILMGFTAYLLVFTTLLNVLRRGLDLRDTVNALDGVAYLALVAWWAYASWRPSEKVVVAPAVARRLGLEVG